MEFFGISWIAAGIGFGAATVLLAGLFFLKPRHRKMMFPSVMLFASARPRAKFRELFRRPARLLHFLLLTLMLATGAAALTEPFLASTKTESTLIVATPAAWQEAGRLAARFHPHRVRLTGTEIAGVTDRTGALWSALQSPFPDGVRPTTVLFLSPEAPSWLPENGIWLQTGERETPMASPIREPAYRLFLENAPRDGFRLPQGLLRTDAAGADALLRSAPGNQEQWAELFQQLRARHGAYTDLFQRMDGISPSVRQLPAGNRKWFAPAGWLWLLTILIFLLDCRLYSRGKVV